MNRQLRNMMAEMESWEAAAEFGIPEAAWASYRVRERSDDLYIACLSSIFDAMRIEHEEQRQNDLASLAKTLIVFSRSAASNYLEGVEKKLNQLYCSTLYYLAGFPATATLLARQLRHDGGLLEEESFILGFLSRRLEQGNTLEESLSGIIENDRTVDLEVLMRNLDSRIVRGLRDDPRKFIASTLAKSCIERFSSTNVWDALRDNAALYSTQLWQPFLNSRSAFQMWELLPSQLEAVRSGLLSDDDETFSLQMPTSAGKTALCELLIFHEVKARGRKVLFLVPFRALAAEIRNGMTRRLADAGVRIIASHGGNIPTRSESTTVEQTDVLIATPEKYTALVQVLPELEYRFDTIICDEGQLIDDEGRGLQYELLLTRLRGTEERPRKVVFISAIVPNMDELHQWLGGESQHLARSDYRPVETDYAFLVQEPNVANAWRLEFNPTEPRPRSFFLLRFLVQNDFRYINPDTSRPKLIQGWNSNLSIACATSLKARRSGSVALFTTSRGRHGVDGLVGKLLLLCEQEASVALGTVASTTDVAGYIEYISFLLGDRHNLARLLQFGIGYHHGMLPQEIRRAMEEGLDKSAITLLVCTTTLAEGVNLPIRTLVVHTISRYDPSMDRREPLPRRTIKNVIGRAGRAGKETRGRVVFVNPTEREFVFEVLRDQRMESAYGALHRLIEAINNYITRHDVPLENEFLDRQTNAAFLAMLDSIDSTLLDLLPPETPQEDLENHVDELLERTLASRFCQTEDLQQCLRSLFRLRAEKLAQSVAAVDWPRLKKSRSSIRFWTFVVESDLLNHSLWEDLVDPQDEEWLSGVILKLLEYPNVDIEASEDFLQETIHGWLTGATYAEIAQSSAADVDDILRVICSDVGFRIHDYVSKLGQLALDIRGEDAISEVARNWSSLLQYGLGSLQQLDLFEAGASDRLAVWGVARYLDALGVRLRGQDLMLFLQENRDSIREALQADGRVPVMSWKRLCDELNL